MTTEIDWDNAPEVATHYADGSFWRYSGPTKAFGSGWQRFLDGSFKETIITPAEFSDCHPRPYSAPKPKYEYGVEYPTNGQKPDLPDDVIVEQYSLADDKWHKGCASMWNWGARTILKFRIVDERYKPVGPTVAQKAPTTSTEYLTACAHVQSERAKQYDASGSGERSFEAAADAFNCVTGKNLRGSDVCLILEMVKLVRQYSDPTRLHEDSVLDAVSYLSLWAEELTKELR